MPLVLRGGSRGRGGGNVRRDCLSRIRGTAQSQRAQKKKTYKFVNIHDYTHVQANLSTAVKDLILIRSRNFLRPKGGVLADGNFAAMFSPSDVSVIIPAYNVGPYFRAALESVLIEEPGEILVVDDASATPLPDFCRKIPDLVILRHEANRGPGAARNTGIARATRSWVTFIDSDDLWVPGKLSLQLRLAREHGADVLVGITEFMGPEGGSDPARHPPRHTPVMGGMLIRREVALKIPEDETSYLSEDLDFYMQVKEAGLKLHRHDDLVYRYRRGIESLTSGLTAEQRKQSLFRTLSRSLSRRRGADSNNQEKPHEISTP